MNGVVKTVTGKLTQRHTHLCKAYIFTWTKKLNRATKTLNRFKLIQRWNALWNPRFLPRSATPVPMACHAVENARSFRCRFSVGGLYEYMWIVRINMCSENYLWMYAFWCHGCLSLTGMTIESDTETTLTLKQVIWSLQAMPQLPSIRCDTLRCQGFQMPERCLRGVTDRRAGRPGVRLLGLKRSNQSPAGPFHTAIDKPSIRHFCGAVSSGSSGWASFDNTQTVPVQTLVHQPLSASFLLYVVEALMPCLQTVPFSYLVYLSK